MKTLATVLIALSAVALAMGDVTMRDSELRTLKAMSNFNNIKRQLEFPKNGSGEYQYQMSRPEGQRTFWAYVPKSYDGSKAVPLVFTFHGLGDDCYSFGHNTGLIDQADDNNFILVYPCGYPGLLGNAWNAGTCCLDGYPIDDVQFTRNMVKYMQANWNIDSSRVFTTGFSNGAFMTEILLCNASDVFVAGVSVSGIVELLPGNSGGESNCNTNYGVLKRMSSLLHIHGDFDIVVPWTGDEILGFPDVPSDFSDWATRNKCDGQPVNTFNSGPYSNQVYQTCGSSTTLELVKHSGGGHEWPSDQYFDTATYAWKYLSKVVPRPAGAVTADNAIAADPVKLLSRKH
jgi:poly(3-hydroxybutyrate) depolymerase